MPLRALLEASTYTTLLSCRVVSAILSLVILALSILLSAYAPDPEKSSAYECGFEPFEDAREQFDVRFYIVAILFLLFDLEIAVLFPWAPTFALTGGAAYRTVVLFLALLTLGFLVEIAKGALRPQ